MLNHLAIYLGNYSFLIDLLTYLTLFIGGFYVALHSRTMPLWLVTCLWYIGVSSMLIAITIVLELVYGQMFPLSHFLIGVIPETLLKFSLLTTVTLLFIKTVTEDIKGSQKRKKH